MEDAFELETTVGVKPFQNLMTVTAKRLRDVAKDLEKQASEPDSWGFSEMKSRITIKIDVKVK